MERLRIAEQRADKADKAREQAEQRAKEEAKAREQAEAQAKEEKKQRQERSILRGLPPMAQHGMGSSSGAFVPHNHASANAIETNIVPTFKSLSDAILAGSESSEFKSLNLKDNASFWKSHSASPRGNLRTQTAERLEAVEGMVAAR